jgi:hypothetical protein
MHFDIILSRKFGANVITLYPKLEHFSGLGRIDHNYKMTKLTKRASVFVPKMFYPMLVPIVIS